MRLLWVCWIVRFVDVWNRLDCGCLVYVFLENLLLVVFVVIDCVGCCWIGLRYCGCKLLWLVVWIFDLSCGWLWRCLVWCDRLCNCLWICLYCLVCRYRLSGLVLVFLCFVLLCVWLYGWWWGWWYVFFLVLICLWVLFWCGLLYIWYLGCLRYRIMWCLCCFSF